MELQDQNRTGLFPEHKGVKLEAATITNVRLTLPAKEALESHGAKIVLTNSVEGLHDVTPGPTLPVGLIATRIDCPGPVTPVGLRLASEPEYPFEFGHAYWEQLAFTPCPKCQSPLIWYEAGYVPGYRVCAGAKHHHWLAR